MKKKLIALFVGITSTSVMASWAPGDFDGVFNIGGSINKSNFSQSWQWKLGEALDFQRDWGDLTGDDKNILTLRVDGPKGILYGETISAIDPRGSSNSGALPHIQFSDFEGSEVRLVQDPADKEGRGYITLPIKGVDNSSKIGSLKVNLTAIGMAVGPANDANGGPRQKFNTSLSASSTNHALYGGLFERNIASAHQTANNVVARFNGTSLNDLQKKVQTVYPEMTGGWVEGRHPRPHNFTDGFFKHGIAAVSYVLGIDQDQTLDATFTSPINSTTTWSAPLNVTVRYN